MKTPFNVILLLMAVSLLLTQCEYNDSVDIPDDAFLNALIEEGVDNNGDGRISSREAKAETILEIEGWRIKDMTGIEAFVNLLWLHCLDNELDNLDVSNNTYLSWLLCEDNNLSSLDVSNCPDLWDFWCGGNQLTSLDISNNTAIDSSPWMYYDYTLYIDNMPTLYEVCVWSMSFPQTDMRIYKEGSPNVYFTTECGQ